MMINQATFIGQKFAYFSRSFFLNSDTPGVISGIKCYQFNEFDASMSLYGNCFNEFVLYEFEYVLLKSNML